MRMFRSTPGVPRGKMEPVGGFSVPTKAAQGRR